MKFIPKDTKKVDPRKVSELPVGTVFINQRGDLLLRGFSYVMCISSKRIIVGCAWKVEDNFHSVIRVLDVELVEV